jgi:hypothetical protein
MESSEGVKDDLIRIAALEILGGGPLPTAVLVDELARRGLLDHLDDLDPDDRVDEVATVLEDSEAFYEVGELVASTAQLLDGIALTHVVTQAELDLPAITVTPDLGVIDFDDEHGLRLQGGGRCEIVFPPEVPSADGNGSLTGPHGWLAALPGPGLAVFRRRGDELVVVVASDVSDLSDGADELEALREAIAEFAVPGTGFESEAAVMSALIADPTLFRNPTRPVGTLLAELGFESHGAWFGPAEEDWAPPGVRYMERLTEEVIHRWEFNRCCAVAFDIVREAWIGSLNPDPLDQVTRRAASRALLHDPVSRAFVDFVLRDGRQGSPSLARFANQLLDQPQSVRAPGHYLLAMNGERDREVEAAETHLAEAVLLDPEYAAAVSEYAWYVADRGDLSRASSLLVRAGAGPGDPDYDSLIDQAARVQANTAKVGRNDPCPCGSGKRYKQCCISSGTTPIERRAGWLSHKLERFALRPMRRSRVVELADVFEDMGSKLEESTSTVLIDIAAWEPELIQEFIETRGYLLPADELLLLEEWKHVQLEMYEVVEVDPGATVTVRNTRNGDQILVTERTASRSLTPSTYLLTRIARVGSQHQVVGAVIPLALSERESALQLLDGGYSSEDVAAWLAWITRPPTMTNREGHDLVMCSRTLRPVGVEWEVVAGALDDAFEASDDGTWTDLVDIDGDQVVRAVIRRDGQHLVVETNSVRRSEELAGLLMDLEDISFEVVDNVESTWVEFAASHPPELATEGSAWFKGDDTSDMPDELRQDMEDMMAERERNWIDESVPALGGLSPRQALHDPTRREDLLALLAEFERRGAGEPSFVTFNVDRIRGLLGL